MVGMDLFGIFVEYGRVLFFIWDLYDYLVYVMCLVYSNVSEFKMIIVLSIFYYNSGVNVV